ncbi:MAG: type II toxin-antitoxin system PemK/MazF family toxin [Sulfuricurvum sp.]|jgi:mRNA interferase MazF|uniref:type II toxin-antitoxin system PemK/MazF family toxin n=1 Tax=Sulfuricurvum sp. TaxID=2025608 RepID=UPI0025F3F1EC|nr:type II toxin-antitoxin system PemK/MazF family toxin [Sulfuricurvum sp.]MCI4405952.1 type II toxin-antitoxin system PemK/MazF family toxin [Sulfuricurvum sp.]
MKKFDEWNEVKKQVDTRSNIIQFKEREVYWASVGENVGFEQNGKGVDFARPVLVIKKLNKNLFFGVPLSTQSRMGSFFFEFELLPNQKSTALLVQAKVYDAKRLAKKIGMIKEEEFKLLKDNLKNLLDF